MSILNSSLDTTEKVINEIKMKKESMLREKDLKYDKEHEIHVGQSKKKSNIHITGLQRRGERKCGRE